MTDPNLAGLPPAPPAPPAPLASAPAEVAPPWQERLEVISLLLLLAAALTVLARLATAYDQMKAVRPFGDGSVDLVAVVRLGGQAVGPIAAASVLLAFLLVTLGPGDRISQRGVLALRAATVIGLVVAGVCAFAAIATIADGDDVGSTINGVSTTARDLINRLGVAVPLVIAGLIAGYVAWCAFATLGETPELVGADPAADLGTAAEGSWDLPPGP